MLWDVGESESVKAHLLHVSGVSGVQQGTGAGVVDALRVLTKPSPSSPLSLFLPPPPHFPSFWKLPSPSSSSASSQRSIIAAS